MKHALCSLLIATPLGGIRFLPCFPSRAVSSVISLALASVLIGSLATSSSAQTDWSKHPTPVLEIGPPGSWESVTAVIVSVLKEGDQYRAWYVGVDEEDAGRIGHATSPDGITWTKDEENNPVLDLGDPGDWDDANVDHCSVVHVGGEYVMWYNGEDGNSARIGRATSVDGVNWVKDSLHNPVLDLGSPGSWDDSEVLHPDVLFDGTTYHMWYNGFGASAQRSGYAYSSDGIDWTKDPSNPVMDVGDPGEFDDYMLVLSATIWKDGEYQKWYGGGDGTDEDNLYFRVGYATSPNETDWVKSEDNPVLDLGPTGAWDELGVVTAAVLYDEDEQIYKMWYGGINESGARTGYATSEPVSALPDGADSSPGTNPGWGPESPDSAGPDSGGADRGNLFVGGVHPNPFVGEATLAYRLADSSPVQIAVFDAQGQRVAVLLDETRSAGSHRVTWDGRSASGRFVAPGVYWMRVRVGEQETAVQVVRAK